LRFDLRFDFPPRADNRGDVDFGLDDAVAVVAGFLRPAVDNEAGVADLIRATFAESAGTLFTSTARDELTIFASDAVKNAVTRSGEQNVML
jgi:hypothetical protein